jgi:hypothetical protein
MMTIGNPLANASDVVRPPGFEIKEVGGVHQPMDVRVWPNTKTCRSPEKWV